MRCSVVDVHESERTEDGSTLRTVVGKTDIGSVVGSGTQVHGTDTISDSVVASGANVHCSEPDTDSVVVSRAKVHGSETVNRDVYLSDSVGDAVDSTTDELKSTVPAGEAVADELAREGVTSSLSDTG